MIATIRFMVLITTVADASQGKAILISSATVSDSTFVPFIQTLVLALATNYIYETVRHPPMVVTIRIAELIAVAADSSHESATMQRTYWAAIARSATHRASRVE